MITLFANNCRIYILHHIKSVMECIVLKHPVIHNLFLSAIARSSFGSGDWNPFKPVVLADQIAALSVLSSVLGDHLVTYEVTASADGHPPQAPTKITPQDNCSIFSDSVNRANRLVL